jgi:hypothetical protein
VQADLDQLVGEQRVADRGQHTVGHALVPDLHDRLEVMGARAQAPALCRREGRMKHSLLGHGGRELGSRHRPQQAALSA